MNQNSNGITDAFNRTQGVKGFGLLSDTTNFKGNNANMSNQQSSKSNAQNLASARSLFGRGKRPLRSIRLQDTNMQFSNLNLQGLNLGSQTTKGAAQQQLHGTASQNQSSLAGSNN